MARQKSVSSMENILEDLKHQARERSRQRDPGQRAPVRLKARAPFSQILALLMSISICFLVLGSQFHLSFFEAAGVFVLIAGASGLILYLIRKIT